MAVFWLVEMDLSHWFGETHFHATLSTYIHPKTNLSHG
jgi:hypothetical protein